MPLPPYRQCVANGGARITVVTAEAEDDSRFPLLCPRRDPETRVRRDDERNADVDRRNPIIGIQDYADRNRHCLRSAVSEQASREPVSAKVRLGLADQQRLDRRVRPPRHTS